MENEVFEIITEHLTNERLSKIIAKDEEYRAALTHEQETYSKLDATLSEEQKRLVDRYGMTQGEVAANQIKLTYQQGMKDMYNLLMSLQSKNEKEE